MLLPPEGNALSSELRGHISVIVSDYGGLDKRRVVSMKVPIQWLIVLLMSPGLAGCGVLAGPDTAATLQADNQQMVAEATAIAAAAVDDRAVVRQTSEAAMTRAAEIYAENLRLRGTVEAGADAGVSVGINTDLRRPDITPGQPWYVLTGLAAFVDPTTGCVQSPQIAFSADTPVIYMTFVAYDARAATALDVSWEYEATVIHQESGTVPNSSSEQCLWFSLEATTADLLPGNWIVRLVVDGVQIGTPMSFTIREADMIDGG